MGKYIFLWPNEYRVFYILLTEFDVSSQKQYCLGNFCKNNPSRDNEKWIKKGIKFFIYYTPQNKKTFITQFVRNDFKLKTSNKNRQ